MKKIGFVDYYLSQWHANNYPRFFKNVAGDRMEVAYAYAEMDSPNGITTKEWGEKYGVEIVDSIEKLVELSDYIIVMAPDNPETHVRLTDIPLKSGKPVYVDKTFAFKSEEAKAIFANADAHNTPCYSSSALYFSDELAEVKREGIKKLTSFGGGSFEIYLVHQVEQIVALMGYDAKRVMYFGNDSFPTLLIEFSDDRYAEVNFYNGQNFNMTIGYDDNSSVRLEVKKDFWENFTRAMADFFENPVPPVSHEQTLAVVAIIVAAIKAKNTPFEWVEII